MANRANAVKLECMQHVTQHKPRIITVQLQMIWPIESLFTVYDKTSKQLRFFKSNQGPSEISAVLPGQNDKSEERGWSWTSASLASAFLQVSILAIAFNIYRTVQVSLLMEELLSDAHVYPDFYFLAFWQVLYNNMIAVNIFFAWIKVLVLIPFFCTQESVFLSTAEMFSFTSSAAVGLKGRIWFWRFQKSLRLPPSRKHESHKFQAHLKKNFAQRQLSPLEQLGNYQTASSDSVVS